MINATLLMIYIHLPPTNTEAVPGAILFTNIKIYAHIKLTIIGINHCISETVNEFSGINNTHILLGIFIINIWKAYTKKELSAKSASGTKRFVLIPYETIIGKSRTPVNINN